MVEQHPELLGIADCISGHHGFKAIGAHRIILDASGGRPDDADPQRSLDAIILPSREGTSTILSRCREFP